MSARSFIEAQRGARGRVTLAIGMVAAVSLLVAAPGGVAAEPITILGLPLGGKLSPAPKVCKYSEVASPTATCFIDKPSKYDGGLYGVLNLPDAQKPRWAMYGRLKVSISSAGELERMDYSTSENRAPLSEIIDSIGARFGAPTSQDLRGTQIPWAAWELPSVHIRATQWGDRCCDVAFITPKAAAKAAEEARRHKAQESARPISP